MNSTSDVFLALASGAIGAIVAQLISIWHMRKLEDERAALLRQLETERQTFALQRVKLDVLRKIAGNRAAVTDIPLDEQRPRFFEGLNEVMVVFSGSNDVSRALVSYKAAVGTPNHRDRLIDLFKAICRDVGIDPSAFNDSLFLQPFTWAKNPRAEHR